MSNLDPGPAPPPSLFGSRANLPEDSFQASVKPTIIEATKRIPVENPFSAANSLQTNFTESPELRQLSQEDRIRGYPYGFVS